MAGFAGDVSVEETWEALKNDPDAVLVDVRTDAEWSFVGIADLSSLGKQPFLISWQIYPSMQVNADFVDMMQQQGIAQSAAVYFLCRSGVRSRAAAEMAAAAGYQATYNIAGGFEGDKDKNHHRGGLNGWKAAGLPWLQQ